MWYYLNPRLYLQSKGYIADIQKIRVHAITPLLSCWIWKVFHTMVVHDPKVCHDFEFDPRLYRQGHSADTPETRVRPNTHYCYVNSDNISHNCCL